MTVKCKLDFGRGQELKPFFLLDFRYISTPFFSCFGATMQIKFITTHFWKYICMPFFQFNGAILKF
jgi:hypothetical protein